MTPDAAYKAMQSAKHDEQMAYSAGMHGLMLSGYQYSHPSAFKRGLIDAGRDDDGVFWVEKRNQDTLESKIDPPKTYRRPNWLFVFSFFAAVPIGQMLSGIDAISDAAAKNEVTAIVFLAICFALPFILISLLGIFLSAVYKIINRYKYYFFVALGCMVIICFFGGVFLGNLP
ncbi:hypothetical protein [Dinoroseobacter sp. S76]|uniref:hypothetical protein n=1 Tax=Dinoroseobacter sp. S76 TaxID=3415124 RepID=UPI003C7CA12D